MLFVTGFFDISTREKNEKRVKSENYMIYIKQLLNTFPNFKFIIYLDSTLGKYIDELLIISSSNKNIIINIISIEDLPLWKYISQINECKMCHPYLIYKYTPLYSLVTNSKFYLLKLAIESYPDENCFSWIDFGCMRYKTYYTDFDRYVYEFQPPNHSKLRFCQIGDIYDKDTPIDKYFEEDSKVIGILFGGDKNKLLDLYNFANGIYMDYIKNGKLIYEEHILSYYISLYYDECDIYCCRNIDVLNNTYKIRCDDYNSFKIFVRTFRNRNKRNPSIDELPHGLKRLYRKIDLF